MDKAKSAVKDFISKSGHHDTTVHEHVAPAVTNETVVNKHHEEQQTAVDREVHQDHYHTSVQPVQDREVLPEQHSHRMAPVEHREHHHGDKGALIDSLKQESAQFRNTRTQGATEETHSTAPTVGGEHIHHHVHEKIQPVVQKETIQPSVVHTTIPIHETHHNEAKHHAASALPPVSMSDFKAQGGTLRGREERVESFEGQPKPLGTGVGSTGSTTTSGPHNSNALNKLDPRVDSDRDGSRNAGLAQTSGTTGTTTGTTGTSGPHKSNVLNKADPRVDSDLDGSRNAGLSQTSGTGTTGSHVPTTGTAATTTHTGTSTGHPTTAGTTGTGHTTDTTAKKPSLLDRLNPKKDTDGDGKAGVMD